MDDQRTGRAMVGDRRASRSGPGQGLPDALRGEGHVEVSDTQVSRRVDYRVLHRGCGSDAAGLAESTRSPSSALQAAPERLTQLLLDHLTEHATLAE